MQPSNPIVIELRETLRIDEDLRSEETGLQNRLRDQLLRYYSAMLELIADRADPFLWSLLETAATHEEAKQLTDEQIESLLKKHRVRRLTTEKVLEVINSQILQVSEATITAASSHIRLLIPRLVHQQRDLCGKKMEKLLKILMNLEGREEGECPPSDARVLHSMPGVGKLVLATILVEAAAPIERRDLQSMRSLSGIAPVTRRSGKQKQEVMRRACNGRLRYAFYHWGRTAMQRDQLTKQHYAQLRGKGHSHGRALRGVVDRLLSVAMAMLKQGTLYDPAKRQRYANCVTT